jgi:hypothetical protein
MPRQRQRRSSGDLVDEVVDTAVDAIFDRGRDVFERWRDAQQSRQAAPAHLPSGSVEYTCASCRGKKPLAEMEMVHPSNGFGMCKPCFGFVWEAGKEKAKQFADMARKTAGEAARRATTGTRRTAAPVDRKRPWEVLGIAADASVPEIKKAYRKLAMEWHPDHVPPQASSAEKQEAHVRFQEIQRARDVMMKVRSAPE